MAHFIIFLELLCVLYGHGPDTGQGLYRTLTELTLAQLVAVLQFVASARGVTMLSKP